MGKGTWPNAWASGLASSRPDADAVGNGAYYLATDTLVLSQSDGVSSWTDIATFVDGTTYPTISAFIETLLDDTDAAAAQATLGLVPGTDIQELISDIVDLPTAETDTALVLAPDGAGGVEFRAETGGSGSGGGSDTPFDHGAMGATETIDLADGRWHRGTLSANLTTTVQGFTVDEGDQIIFEVTQDGATPRSITWDTDVEFIGDDQPDQTLGSVTFYNLWTSRGDGTIYGQKVGGDPALSAHLSDATDAHDASAVSFDPTGLAVVSDTDVQGALEELDAAVDSLSTGTGIPSGTSFPGSPSDGDLFYRADLDLLCRYRSTGTRWVTAQLFKADMGFTTNQASATVNLGRFSPFSDDFDLYVEKFYCSVYVLTTNNGSNYWTIDLQKITSGDVSTSMGSFNTSADSPGTWLLKEVSIGAVFQHSAHKTIRVLGSAGAGTPGGLYGAYSMSYRLIVT